MKIFIKSLLIFFIISNVSKADLIRPEPTLKPFDVLLIQLNSLKNNDSPYSDAGIEQVWEFAHPNNKIMTGPLNKFKQMIYSENYEILINHENSEIKLITTTMAMMISQYVFSFICSNQFPQLYPISFLCL